MPGATMPMVKFTSLAACADEAAVNAPSAIATAAMDLVEMNHFMKTP